MNQPVASTAKFYSTHSTKESAIQNHESRRYILTSLCATEMLPESKPHLFQVYGIAKQQLKLSSLKAKALLAVMTTSICHLQHTAE